MTQSAVGPSVMTPREELIQAIQTSSDDIVTVLLDTLKALKQSADEVVRAVSSEDSSMSSKDIEHISERLYRKQGVLVVKTEQVDEFGTSTFIKDMREERVQYLIKQSGL